MTCAVIPGSFDPITLGHMDLIRRAAVLFDSVTVLVMPNPYKSTAFLSVEQRLAMIRAAIDDAALTNVTAETDSALLADYCAARNAVIVKGARDTADFAYEANMASINRSIAGVETLIFPANPSLSFISSTMVRELIRCHKDISAYVPAAIPPFLI